MKFHIDHRFERVSLERFIATYFSEHFNTEVAAISGLRTRALVEEVIEPDGRRRRRVRMHPDVKLPAAIKRFASEEQIHYDEVSSYDPHRHEVSFKIDSKANDRIRFEGTIRFVVEGSGVRRLIDSVIEVNVPFGLGAVIERFIDAEVNKGYAKIQPFLQGYLDRHPDGPPAT